jgi:hypothetical protein
MPVDRVFTKDNLLNFKPKHATFVGIDSDGCVFDTMEIKQRQCFHKFIVSYWHLEPIAQYVRESAEFVNLHSIWRGQNRFPCLLMTIDLLRDRPEVKASGVALPAFTALKKFIASGLPLGNPALEKLVAETHDPELASILQWSKDINADIARTVKNVPPFKSVLPSFAKIQQNSDAICVSQTPTEALVREWAENDIMKYVAIIAGQELGTKTEHIGMATKGRYAPDKILMIGDAPGDQKAAKGNHALFYPINPGHEVASWERFHTEAYDKFLKGEYKGAYEEALIREFNALLPDTPPWKRSATGH